MGYKVGSTMRMVVRALQEAHVLRGVPMSDTTYLALRTFVFTTLARKVGPPCVFELWI